MSEQAIESVMQQAMTTEDGRRDGLDHDIRPEGAEYGNQPELPQSPSAAAVGKSSLDMPARGDGYA